MPEKTVYIAINSTTGATREVKIAFSSLKRVITDGVDRCTGSCGCTVEPDGTCPEGWPSRSLVAGVI